MECVDYVVLWELYVGEYVDFVFGIGYFDFVIFR